MQPSLAVQTRNKVARIYAGGVVAFSVLITLWVSILMIASRTH
jgi:hypothetical protein